MTLLTSLRRLAVVATLGLGFIHAAQAVDASAPDTLIRQLSLETIEAVKADKAIQGGDVSKIISLVDAKVMPYVNFQRMTASAVGRFWRQATPDQ
jgi:phospholipid transport system substrate-binding protein